MNNQQNFKQTEIGKIPREWKVVKLKDFVEIIQGKNYPTAKLKERGYPVFGANGLIGYGDKYHYKEEQVLIACRGSTCGIVNKSLPYSFINNNAMALIIKSDNQIVKKFLFYLMQYNYLNNSIKTIITGTGQPQITLTSLKNFQLPLPPLPEQKKIAEILSTVDEAIEKVDKSIFRTERLKKGLMQKLLTEGIGHKEFKDTEIGRIPREWKVVRLGEIISLFHNGIWGEEAEENEISYPVIRSTEITHDGKIDVTNVALRKIPESKIEKYKLNEGDIVLVASSGSSHLIGRAALFKQFQDKRVYLFSNFMIRLRPKNIVDPNFLFYYLNSQYYYRFLKSLQQTSTGLRNLPKKNFLKLKLPLPPLPEQQKIAEILSTVDKKLEMLRVKKEKLARVKKGLMNDLLTGKRRVILSDSANQIGW